MVFPRPPRSFERSRAFTLIEILIVISIIAILASMTLVVVSQIREKASVSSTKLEVNQLGDALDKYLFDEKVLPGIQTENIDEETNLFPELYRALFGEPAPRGPGGRSAPYGKVAQERIAVKDEDAASGYRRATQEELNDDSVAKYYLDPWDNPLTYRPNKGKPRKSWMKNRDFDLYSKGPNGKDDTILGSEVDEEEYDDIGNW